MWGQVRGALTSTDRKIFKKTFFFFGETAWRRFSTTTTLRTGQVGFRAFSHLGRISEWTRLGGVCAWVSEDKLDRPGFRK